jgi:hypothetical protein
MKWACAVTTCPERRKSLGRTLASLKAGGFAPRLFVDGDPDGASWQRELSCPVTCRDVAARTAANWTLALAELLLRRPDADAYAVFQDDLLCVRNLRAYLEQTRETWPERGYLNLFTFRDNEKVIADAGGRKGWLESSLLKDGESFPHQGEMKQQQTGRGAVALVLPRDAAVDLLSHGHLWTRAKENPDRGWRNVDGGIVEALNRQGWREYVHAPSLVQHTGDVSTIRMPGKPERLVRRARTFPGEQFDALSLLCTEPTPRAAGLGDAVSKALSLVGITEERVSSWLGEKCHCAERRARLNALGAWAARVVSGKAERARELLEQLTGGPGR